MKDSEEWQNCVNEIQEINNMMPSISYLLYASYFEDGVDFR
jgi:hypothetical protein